MAAVVLETASAFLAHEAGPGHPERPARLEAVLAGIEQAGFGEGVLHVAPRAARRDELELVHPAPYLDALQRFCETGGGRIDADTGASGSSWEAAVHGAGSGLDAVERLDRGEAGAAFCAVRPPGHHATAERAMGFCLVNNVAVCAAALARRGERVLIVDYDAHHGNGTQAAFWSDPRVAYVSFHQWPLYPGTGRLDDVGAGDGTGTTVNLPFPPGTAGATYREAVDDVVVPFAERFAPTWLLVSAGFDAHRADPLAGLGLSAGDFGDLTARLVRLVPGGRVVAFLEGGYDLDALGDSAGACVAALAGEVWRPEPATNGDRGRPVVEAARRQHDL
jgi:acetoin utilization deacetylase AcuC-like enzyme